MAVGVLAVLGTWGLVAYETASATRPVPGRGAYLGRPDPTVVEQFSAWAGPPPTTHISSFIPQGREGTRGFREFDRWIADVLPLVAGSTRRLVVSVPLVPAGSTLASVIEGDGHRRLTKLASALRAAGHGRAVIRLGWESNGDWFRWYALADPVGYRRAFRAVVRTLRAAAPGLRFEWNVICQPLAAMVPWYPGDRYVDIVGMDCYARNPRDQAPWARWAAALESARAFAQRHAKRFAVSEWGTSLNDPELVRSFLCWAQEHLIGYHIYWNVPPAPNEEGDTRLSGQPEAAEAYLQNCA